MAKLTKISKRSNIDAEYSDGDIENELLRLFRKGLTEEAKREILSNDPNWALRYHLSELRSNLLNWYTFKNRSSVLEVGSGCGAITEALVENESLTVVANELSGRRAEINYERNKKAKNLEIVVGNLQDFKPKEKFDYVVCVGVLEYAGTFIDADEPYDEFVKLLNSFLKPGGRLLLAIENRLGFKYLAGAREDHTAGYFDGINNYPQNKNVRTFGRNELTELLNRSNYIVEEFYFPHPDYKIPEVVYSDSYLPGVDTVVPKNLLPSPNFDQDRKFLFSEQLFVDAIEDNRLYAHMANSFLVEAIKPGGAKDSVNKTIFGVTKTNRLPQYRIRTTAVKSKKGIYFKKQALNDESVNHIVELEKTFSSLNKAIEKSKEAKISKIVRMDKNTGIAEFELIDGHNAENTLIKYLINEDYTKAQELINKYRKILKAFSVSINKDPHEKVIFNESTFRHFNQDLLIKDGVLDFNLDNFIIDKKTGEWWLIDYEWVINEPIPTDFIEYRGLLSFFSRYKEMIISRAGRKEVLSNDVMAIPKEFLDLLSLDINKFNEAYRIENSIIQKYISGKEFVTNKPKKLVTTKPHENYIEKSDRMLAEINNAITSLKLQNADLEKNAKESEAQLNSIKSSRSYKLVVKLSRFRNKMYKKFRS